MGRIHETVRTANSALRTFLLAIVIVGTGYAAWQGYSLYIEPRKLLAEQERELEQIRQALAEREQTIGVLSEEIDDKNEQLAKLETSLRLLKLSHRVARLHIVDQTTDEDSDRITSTVEFFEVNSEGAPIDARRRRFEIKGDRVYVECLVAKFEDKYVEQADLDRATAICLFQRIFGEYQQPQEGHLLDKIGSSPTSYARGGEISEFEQRIWDDFWNIASDRQRAAELGIRAAHADAPSIRVRPGRTYELELRATGEFTLRPID